MKWAAHWALPAASGCRNGIVWVSERVAPGDARPCLAQRTQCHSSVPSSAAGPGRVPSPSWDRVPLWPQPGQALASLAMFCWHLSSAPPLRQIWTELSGSGPQLSYDGETH